MLPEHIQSASIDGPLKSHQTGTNGGDNIITITAASINECTSSPIDFEQIKSNNTTTQTRTTTTTTTTHTETHTQKIIKFLSRRSTTVAATATDNNSNSNASSSTSTVRRPFVFCNVSQWLSFQDNIAEVHHRKGRRLNGLQLPLHPLQIFGWLVLILFGIASFWILIPSFTVEIQGPLYGLISGLYIVHVVSHLAALLIDPADRELRRVHRNDRIVPEFDRNKHTHVIENGRCHLCNIRTSSQRTKHCSVCNKCVGKFDHHCKWLNHCIGSRNYVAFLMCVVSAVIATLVIVAAVIAQIVLYYVQPEWLSFWYSNGGGGTTAASSTNGAAEILSFVDNINSSLNDTLYGSGNATADYDLAINATNASVFLLEDETFVENSTSLPTLLDNLTTVVTESVNGSILANLSIAATTTATTFDTLTTDATANINSTTASIAGIGISDTIFLVLIGFLGLLAAITAGLLLHLCFFHIYISFLGLTTYEYIRNHRQAQEAKAKTMLSTLPRNGQQNFSTNPSKKTNECGQIYFCSSLRHPNALDANDLNYFEARKATASSEDEHRSRLHCCSDSREYHQTALKTYYMCSLLEEGRQASPPLGISHISGGTDSGSGGLGEDLYGTSEDEPTASNDFKTFHCCSTFAATTTQRKVSTATTKATLVSDIDATAATLSARRSYLQFTEQCTFCTFRIRSPIVAKRSSATSTRSVGRPNSAAHTTDIGRNAKVSSAAANAASTEHQRCCMKAISKHQRWRRKWNCCSSVPDSPDVPNDIISALAMRHQHGGGAASAASTGKKMNATEIPVHFIKTVNGSGTGQDLNSRPTSPRSANLKAQARANHTRTWPLRHMMRMLNRYRRPRCRHPSAGIAVGEQIKQNQIRPLQLQRNTNGQCHHHHHHHHQQQQQQQHYYDSSSPQPPSSTTTASERSSDQSIYSDSSAMSAQTNTIETILPTSVIRDDMSMTYTTPVGICLPPALPPPTRRKIPNPTDLQELAETLAFASHPSSGGGGGLATLSPACQRLPALNNIYRRQRRKHFLRTRSPTLSPIHESGLSNPTSPQPCRHNASNCSPSATSTATAAAAIVVNNICGSSELVRKTSSNSSLHSLSSNSSST